MVGLRDRAGKQRSFYVHRLVLTAFAGACPPGMVGCHGPRGQKCNELTNLRWDSHKANIRERPKPSTLCFNDVADIKRRLAVYRPGIYDLLASEYGVLPQTIKNIHTEHSWSYVDENGRLLNVGKMCALESADGAPTDGCA